MEVDKGVAEREEGKVKGKEEGGGGLVGAGCRAEMGESPVGLSRAQAGWSWAWEKQRETEGRGGSLFMGPWSEISHDHKGRRNEQEQKQTGTEGGRQIHKAGEGGEPQSYQTQAFLSGGREPSKFCRKR